jgi:hypothetical protein
VGKRKRLTFADWITKTNPNRVAEMLGVSRRTVDKWRTGELHPRLPQMQIIVKMTRGRVSYQMIVEGPRALDSR